MSATVEEAKKWLMRFSILNNESDNLFARVEYLKERASSPRTSRALSDIPSPHNWDQDIIGDTTAIYVDIEKKAMQVFKESRVIYKEIQARTEQIRCRNWPDIKFTLQLKYLDLLPWNSIIDYLFMNETDFLDKWDTYQRRTFKIHREGLLQIAELLNEKDLQDMKEFYKKPR